MLYSVWQDSDVGPFFKNLLRTRNPMNNKKDLHIILVTLLFALSACSGNQAATITATPRPTQTSIPTSTPTFTPTPLPIINLESCGKLQEVGRIGDGTLNMLVYSPDGRWLAAATSTEVALYDSSSLSSIWTTKTEANLKYIAFSTDGTTLTGVDVFTRIYKWQVDDGQNIFSKLPDEINELPLAFTLSPDGNFLAIPYYDDSIRLYQTSDGVIANKMEYYSSLGGTIHKIAYSPDGNYLATISLNGDFLLWSIPELKVIKTIEFDQVHRPDGLIFSQDGKTLAVNMKTESGENSIRMFDIYSQSWRQTIQGQLLVFLPDRSFISIDQNIVSLRSFNNGDILTTVSNERHPADVLAVSPNGADLAMGTNSGIQIQKLGDTTTIEIKTRQYSGYSAMSLSSDDLLVALGIPGGVEVRSLMDGLLVRTFTMGDRTTAISSLTYSASGELIAASADSTIYVWDMQSVDPLWSFDTGYIINKLTFSPDGTILAVAYSSDQTLSLGDTNSFHIPLWNSVDGGQLVELKGSDQDFFIGYSSLSFSPDKNYLIATQGGGDIDIWSMADDVLKYKLSFDGILSWNSVLAVSPDSQHFASGAMDRNIRLWKIDNRFPLKTLNVQDASITALSYSANGEIIAAGINYEVRFWNSDTGSFLCSVKGGGDMLQEIAFTRNGRFMITLAKDGIVRIWGTP